MNHCSPKKTIHNSYTCFTKYELIHITKYFNKVLKIQLSTSLNKYELYLQLKKFINPITKCSHEICWLQHKSFLNSLPYSPLKIFKPQMPNKRYALLNTFDINLILSQYEQIFPNFKYLGAQPSNFFSNKNYNIITNAIQNFDFVGLIFNLDEHDQPGSHWVAVFINSKNKTIEYFDSLGHKPIENISRTLNIINFKLITNVLIHQTGNNACGLYAILFIIYKLYFTNNFDYLKFKLPDSKVQTFRKLFFRPLI